MDLRVPLALGLLSASVEGFAKDPILELRAGPALCTAAWVGSSGEVVTAYHCVVARRTLELRDREGRVWSAERVHVDRRRDLAVLRVDQEGTSTGFQVRGERLAVGEDVEVWGHASASSASGVPQLDGLLYYSRFEGTTSAVGQELTQLDVAFNPGISGGPVLDNQGRIVGVASRKLKGEHLSFSSPIGEFWSQRHSSSQTHWFSGQLNARLEFELPADPKAIPSLHFTPELVLWDWVVVEAGVGTGVGQVREALSRGEVHWKSSQLGFLGRVRAGSGPLSLSFDVGPSIWLQRSLQVLPQAEQVGFVARQGESGVQALVRANWRGWSMGMTWEPTKEVWALQFGTRVLRNVLLF